MTELPFKMAAKAARLFGRENVSNANGAISELVKNTYDADATKCFVCFIPHYNSLPNELSTVEIEWLLKKSLTIEVFYIEHHGKFLLRDNLTDEERNSAKKLTDQLLDLCILDNGTGMTSEVIENSWMVIGTNYKENFLFSDGGRTRTGAKGIGRFALDRLGSLCELHSTTKDQYINKKGSLQWNIDWSKFESPSAILGEVTATLTEDGPTVVNKLDELKNIQQLSKFFDTSNAVGDEWSSGTFIRIGLLRDDWSTKQIASLRKSLEVLVPPIEQKELNIYLFDSRNSKEDPKIGSNMLDDFDYEIEAKIKENKTVEFAITRKEIDHDKLPPELFDLSEMQHFPFNKKSFMQQKIVYEKSFTELFPGHTKDFLTDALKLGPFDLVLRFYKMLNPTAKNIEKYCYKTYQPGPRKAWLEEFGGIKIYRDNFFVRPYGETKSKDYDWLGLGDRRAKNPAQASRKSWTVSPQNIAGTVNISKHTNSLLNDQSNREGILENEYFDIFQEFLKRVIKEFEADRSHILFNLNAHSISNGNFEESRDEGVKIAKQISAKPSRATTDHAILLSETVKFQEEEIRDLKDEQSMLRSLATLGTVLVSFSHEMGQLQNTMGSRSAELSDILSSYISPDDLAGLDIAFNPYQMLSDWADDDKKVKQWFRFALSSIKADKRRRKKIHLKDHLQKIKLNWSGFLEPRFIELKVDFKEDVNPVLLAFEIDLDSIFNNLILNSVEALVSPKHRGARKIEIEVSLLRDSEVFIRYTDNGPGLDISIKDPSDIFKFAETTKRDSTGKAVGTGLGMWILSTVVNQYSGTAKALHTEKGDGFLMEISLPIRQGGK